LYLELSDFITTLNIYSLVYEKLIVNVFMTFDAKQIDTEINAVKLSATLVV